ncbi:glycine-rich protein 2-like [Pyrus ussuriensis x Pyrus communis]|uniref:Glycine-rich protein 2-like n=1 Tax=Pyrus ussuriensis x Pyrus communis TaxID=2448454 RepID=A0A5N5G458_9ROSA|nr:glycine-rich protein 2-like [Pyrus ussuriensis x Pyrus communis]
MIKIDIVMIIVATTLVASPMLVLIIGYCGFGWGATMVVVKMVVAITKILAVARAVGSTMIIMMVATIRVGDCGCGDMVAIVVVVTVMLVAVVTITSMITTTMVIVITIVVIAVTVVLTMMLVMMVEM